MSHRGAGVDLDRPSHARFATSYYLRLMQRSTAIIRRDLYLQMANDAAMGSDSAMATELRCMAVGVCECFDAEVKCEGCWSKTRGGHDAGIFRVA